MAKYDLDFVAEWESAMRFDTVDDGVQVIPVSLVQEFLDTAPYEGGTFPYSPLRPMLIVFGPAPTGEAGQFGLQAVAVAQVLSRLIGEDAEVETCGADGVETCLVRDIPKVWWITAVYVPSFDPVLEPSRAGADPRTMQHIVARLRQPDGCPWDRKQTHQSLRNALIEETYEIVDAIDSGDMEHLAEELGDLFIHILMQAQIAHEAGEFSIEDVYRGIASKIVGRHPHVFGDAVVVTEADLSGVWAEAKAKEKAVTGDRGGKDVDGEPFSMPALERAARVLKKHPVVADDDAPELLRLVGEIIASGEDPEQLLRRQLREHVARNR